MRVIQIQFDDFLMTLGRALGEAVKKDAAIKQVEVGVNLVGNSFAVIAGDERTTWQMDMPASMTDRVMALYSLLTHVMDFGTDVYDVFAKAIKDHKEGWVVIVMVDESVHAEYREAL